MIIHVVVSADTVCGVVLCDVAKVFPLPLPQSHHLFTEISLKRSPSSNRFIHQLQGGVISLLLIWECRVSQAKLTHAFLSTMLDSNYPNIFSSILIWLKQL